MANQVLRKEKGLFAGSTGKGATDVPESAPQKVRGDETVDTTTTKPKLGTSCTRYTDTVGENGKRTLCGSPVLEGQDWCKKCPGYKKSAPGKNQATPAPQTEGAIKADLVRQCAGTVTDARTSTEKQCKNAILQPATYCHNHGGDIETSLFRSYAKATAEARRGELVPLTPEQLKENPDAGRTLMERDLLDLIETDPSAFLKLADAAARFDNEHTVGRFSPGNQLTTLSYAYHYERQNDPAADKDECLKLAIARVSTQALHTKKGWDNLGRAVNFDAEPVPVTFYSPGRTATLVEDTTPDNNTEDTPAADKKKEKTSFSPRWGVRVQYFADQTTGEDLPERIDPLDLPLPAGHGDPDAYRSFLTSQANSVGVSVVEDPTPKGNAKAFYRPSEKTIHLWSGHAGGDPATQAHTLAHELGHALDPKLDNAAYGKSGCNERGRAEVFAETFAFLVSSRYGVNSKESSAGYSAGWASSLGGLGSREAMGVMKDALTAAHGVLYPKKEAATA